MAILNHISCVYQAVELFSGHFNQIEKPSS